MKEKKIINQDPLDFSKRFRPGGNYETPFYNKEIYIPTEYDVLLFLKRVEGLQIYSTVASAVKVFRGIVDKGEPSWSVTPSMYVIAELNKSKDINWYETSLRCEIETGHYPKEWNAKEIKEYIIKSVNVAVENNANGLRALLLGDICCSGEVIIRDTKTWGYLKQMKYRGEGVQVEELCGSGGITFYAEENSFFHYQTWVS